jgi:hypothetical protein
MHEISQGQLQRSRTTTEPTRTTQHDSTICGDVLENYVMKVHDSNARNDGRLESFADRNTFTVVNRFYVPVRPASVAGILVFDCLIGNLQSFIDDRKRFA